MKETKQAILDGVSADNFRIVAPNTVEYFKNGNRFIRLHHTDILVFSNDSLRLSSGGWKTQTTKDRISKSLPSGYRLFSENGLWIVSSPKGCFPFQDGMVFDLKTHKAQDVPSLDVAKKEYKTRQKKITDYINAYAKKLFSGEMEKPSSDDCWICQFKREKQDSAHIRQHIKEMYLVPSLIWLALDTTNESDALKHDVYVLQHGAEEKTFFNDDKAIRRCLRRFFRSQLS